MHTRPPGRDAPASPLGESDRALPLGLDIELFTGPTTPETALERATRLAVAWAVLAELREAGRTDQVSALDAEYAAALLTTAPARCPTEPTRSAA